jgi:hypothetical protein
MASLVSGTTNKIFLAGTLTDGGSDAGITAVQNKFDESGWNCSLSDSGKGTVLEFPKDTVIHQERIPSAFEKFEKYRGSLIKLSKATKEGPPTTVLLSRPEGPTNEISYRNQASLGFDSEERRLSVQWCKQPFDAKSINKYQGPTDFEASDFSSAVLPNGARIARLGKHNDASRSASNPAANGRQATVEDCPEDCNNA